MSHDLTQVTLKEMLHYDPTTGIWTWLKDTTKTGPRRIGTAAGATDKRGYRLIGLFGKRYRAARLAFLYMTGEWPKHTVDHKNHITDDDRWDNLRNATYNENNVNVRRKRKYALPRGVVKHGRKFRAQTKVNRKHVCIGSFDTPEEAHEAYLAKMRQLNLHEFVC